MRVYGKNVALAVLQENTKVNSIYLSNHFKEEEILRLINKKNIPYKIIDSREMDRMESGLHQGIIMDIEDIKTYDLEEIIHNVKKDNALVVILDHLEDPHNFGAIIRSCEAFGVDAIIIPKDRSVPINSTVYKTSVGTIEKVKIIKVANINNAIEKLKKHNYWIIGTDMEGEDYTSIDYKTNIALIIGNEGKGMSPIVKKNCDYLAKIPMEGTVNSLNASVACGVFLSEIVRSRK